MTFTTFLNVDVTLEGVSDTNVISGLLALDFFVVSADDSRFTLEMSAPFDSAQHALDEIVVRLRKLDAERLAAWHGCTRRSADIGIATGEAPHNAVFRICASTLAAAAILDLDLAFVVYGFRDDEPAGSCF